jgi:hypothetical protein
VWSFIICSRVILSKPRYKGTNDCMNACTLKQNALLLCQHRRSRFQTEHQ